MSARPPKLGAAKLSENFVTINITKFPGIVTNKTIAVVILKTIVKETVTQIQHSQCRAGFRLQN
jgi:hypothetical protein